MVHGPEVAEFMEDDVVDKRKGHGNELGGESDFSPHRAAAPAALHAAHAQGICMRMIAKCGSRRTIQPCKAAGKDFLGSITLPSAKGLFQCRSSAA